MSDLQGTQPDAPLWYKYGYVALTSLWVYDYMLCIPDSVTYIVESRWGLSTLLYLASSHLPSVFLLLGMLTLFQLNAPHTLCRSYDRAHLYVGFLAVFSTECLFILRTFAVYHWRRKYVVSLAIGVIVLLVPMIFCFHAFVSSAFGECSLPGFIKGVDTKANSLLIVMYVLLGVGKFVILLFLLYRAAEIRSSGQRINGRLMRGLMQHNLLYFGCSFAFQLGLALSEIFFPFAVTYIIAESQVVAQALLFTQMHRDFWNSDYASYGTYGDDLSLTTFVATASDYGTGSVRPS